MHKSLCRRPLACSMSPSNKPCYRTTNCKQYNAALKARGSLSIWLDNCLAWFSDAAIQLCLTLNNLFGLALRQTTGMVESVLQLCGLAWPVPDFSTLCRRQRDLNVQIPYSPSKAGLHLHQHLVEGLSLKSGQIYLLQTCNLHNFQAKSQQTTGGKLPNPCRLTPALQPTSFHRTRCDSLSWAC